MAGKDWTTQVAAAAGAAAGTGAAQLGLGYGLGVVVWPVVATKDDSVWLGSLGWATWIAASATVFGAVIAARLRGAQAPRLGGPWRFALATSAAIGALLTVALVAVPARPAVRADTFAPEMIAGGYAVIGIVLGLVIAYWAVVSRAVAANLIATASYLWALAAAGIVVELTLHRESATYLTSWQFAELGTEARYGTIYWPSALLTLLAALIIGMIAAWPSTRAGNLGVGTASSGAVGPLLVAAAFLVLAPQLTGALGQLESAYLIAPYAVLAGLAGSALMVASGQRSARRRAARIARIHRPAPPAATGKAAVPAQPSELDTPPTGTPQVSAATRPRKSARAKTSAEPRPAIPSQVAATDQTSAGARTPGRAQTAVVGQRPGPAKAAAGSQTADSGSVGVDDEDRPAAPSGRPGLWGRLRRGGRAKPSATTDEAGAPTSDPAPSGAPQSGTSQAGTSQAGTSQARGTQASTSQPRGTQAGASQASTSSASPSGDGTPSPRPTSPRAATPAAPSQQGRPASRAAGSAPAPRGAADSAGPKDQPRTSARSTVAAPPPTPPIAKINPPREAAAEPGSTTAQPTGRSTPAKATPAKAAPSKATPSKASPAAKAAPPKPQPEPKSDKSD